MFKINEDKSIYLTRGDIATLEITADSLSGAHSFKEGDVVRFKVFEKKDCGCVVLQKDVVVTGESTAVDMFLDREDTKIGELINKPKDYWYEVELNPDTAPQTFVCYDEDGPKIFTLFPEGSDVNEY